MTKTSKIRGATLREIHNDLAERYKIAIEEYNALKIRFELVKKTNEAVLAQSRAYQDVSDKYQKRSEQLQELNEWLESQACDYVKTINVLSSIMMDKIRRQKPEISGGRFSVDYALKNFFELNPGEMIAPPHHPRVKNPPSSENLRDECKKSK